MNSLGVRHTADYVHTIKELIHCVRKYERIDEMFSAVQKTRDEYAEDVAAHRGHSGLKGVLTSYRQVRPLAPCSPPIFSINFSIIS